MKRESLRPKFCTEARDSVLKLLLPSPHLLLLLLLPSLFLLLLLPAPRLPSLLLLKLLPKTDTCLLTISINQNDDDA